MRKLITSFLLLLLSLSLYSKETLILSTGEWPPYTSEKDPKARVVQTLITETYKLANIDVLYKYYPWKRALRKAEDIEVDGSLPWSRTESREKLFYYSKKPIVNTRTVFFHLKSFNFDWESYEDLKSYSIGGTIGYTATEFLKNKGLDVQ